MSDELLDLLGDYFVAQRFIENGWTFEEFLEEYESGHISLQ